MLFSVNNQEQRKKPVTDDSRNMHSKKAEDAREMRARDARASALRGLCPDIQSRSRSLLNT